MKLGKRLLTFILVGVLVIGTQVNAFAATNSDIVTALTSAGVNGKVISMTLKYLHNHSVSAKNLDIVVAKIRAVQAQGVRSLADYRNLSAANKAIVAANIRAGAAALGITITKNADGSFTLTDSNGIVVGTVSERGVVLSNNCLNTGAAGNTTATNYGNLLGLGAVIASIGSILLLIRKRECATE